MKPNGAGKLLSMAEAAEACDEKPRILRERLLALHERFGGKLLQSFEPPGKPVRKWFISPDALMSYLRTDHQASDERIEAVEARVRQLEARQIALRNSHRALRKEAKQEFAKQKRWNTAIRKALEGLVEAQSIDGR